MNREIMRRKGRQGKTKQACQQHAPNTQLLGTHAMTQANSTIIAHTQQPPTTTHCLELIIPDKSQQAQHTACQHQPQHNMVLSKTATLSMTSNTCAPHKHANTTRCKNKCTHTRDHVWPTCKHGSTDRQYVHILAQHIGNSIKITVSHLPQQGST